MEVVQQFALHQAQAVANPFFLPYGTEIPLLDHLSPGGIPYLGFQGKASAHGKGRLGRALLSLEQIADGIYRLKLVVQMGLKM